MHGIIWASVSLNQQMAYRIYVYLQLFATIIIITSTAQNHHQLKASIKRIINATKKKSIQQKIYMYIHTYMQQRSIARGR